MLTGARLRSRRRQDGAALMEVLVSLLIIAFGLLSLAGLQTRMNSAVLESFQRSQALTLLQDMAQRMQANLNQGASYLTTTAGTGDSPASNCSTLATRAAVDLCEWSKALQGAAETQGSANTMVGAMIGARGCVQQIQAANTATGICQPAIYRVTIAWQGMNSTVVPPVNCGAGQYGSDDTLRKAISLQVVTPLPNCS
jgi:type IV pilus assembly protein PilV